jgi:hypothetical protein
MFDQVTRVKFQGQEYEQSHGSPFDRGSADSYYHRGPVPHWYPKGTGHDPRVEARDMSPEEIDAYFAGYNQNEQLGNKKDWGNGND